MAKVSNSTVSSALLSEQVKDTSLVSTENISHGNFFKVLAGCGPSSLRSTGGTPATAEAGGLLIEGFLQSLTRNKKFTQKIFRFIVMIHEMKQVMWVDTPHGEGLVILVMDYGVNHNTVWVVANKEDGKIRHYDSNHISMTKNCTLDLKV